ncbi:hypothetical protein DSECCO2_326050 [anaerobic digester metagenome]
MSSSAVAFTRILFPVFVKTGVQLAFMVGGVLSTVKLIIEVPMLPIPSKAINSTLYMPSAASGTVKSRFQLLPEPLFILYRFPIAFATIYDVSELD